VADAAARADKARVEATRQAGVPRISLPVAGRVPTPFPFTVTVGPNGTFWMLDNTQGSSGGPFGGFCNGTPGVGVIDAGTIATGDAYDNGYSIYVEGLIFAAGSADLTGNTVTVGPVVQPSGLSVTRQLFFSPTRQVMRIVDTFQNPTGAGIAVLAQVPVNFGSDGGTFLEATSSGDQNFTIADRWLITSDGPTPSDPVNTGVLFGPGTPAVTPTSVTQTVYDCATPDGSGWTFNFLVPGGATRRLMFYAGLEDMLGTGNTAAGALANAAIFNDAMAMHNTTDLTSGLTNAELLQIVNWDFTFVPVELQSFGVE
jgi:hypothetical protein